MINMEIGYLLRSSRFRITDQRTVFVISTEGRYLTLLVWISHIRMRFQPPVEMTPFCDRISIVTYAK